MEYLNLFIKAMIGALGVATVTSIIAIINLLISLNKKIDKLIKNDVQQTESIYMLAKIAKTNLSAHKVTIAALKSGKCNGNATKTLEKLVNMETEFDKYLLTQKVGVQ